MIAAVQDLGLTSGLRLCLDAGDVNSYTGTGQKWLDTSGNGYDFFRGTTSSSQSSDPTFNGTAGGQSSSEYWSFDGGDFFTYDSANETWMNNLHKDNAVLSIAGWVWIASTGEQQPILATALSTADRGAALFINSTGLLRWGVVTGGGTGTAASVIGGLSVGTGGWHFVGITLTEATGSNGATMQVDGTQESLTSTYSSPSSSSATYTMTIGRAEVPEGALHFRSGGRIANVAAWEGAALTGQNLTALYNLTKSKFGL
jgi:hypothetical protein